MRTQHGSVRQADGPAFACVSSPSSATRAPKTVSQRQLIKLPNRHRCHGRRDPCDCVSFSAGSLGRQAESTAAGRSGSVALSHLISRGRAGAAGGGAGATVPLLRVTVTTTFTPTPSPPCRRIYARRVVIEYPRDDGPYAQYAPRLRPPRIADRTSSRISVPLHARRQTEAKAVAGWLSQIPHIQQPRHGVRPGAKPHRRYILEGQQ